MMTAHRRFNIYLLVALAGLAGGCQSTKDDDEAAATLKVHLEVTPDSMDFSKQVPIFRAKPVMVNVDKNPILTEAFVSEAKLIEKDGTFEIEIQFERRGSWLLESYTTTNPGKHFAIFSEFGADLKESRWLGAPIIHRRISNGILTFTPDASREEADQIVKGLNAVAAKVREKSKW
jgi:preprotein translocase subunit SecD